MIKFLLSCILCFGVNYGSAADFVQGEDLLAKLLHNLHSIEDLYSHGTYAGRTINGLGNNCDQLLHQMWQSGKCFVCRPYVENAPYSTYVFNPQTPVASVISAWERYRSLPDDSKWNNFWSALVSAKNIYYNPHSSPWMAHKLSQLNELLDVQHSTFCLPYTQLYEPGNILPPQPCATPQGNNSSYQNNPCLSGGTYSAEPPYHAVPSSSFSVAVEQEEGHKTPSDTAPSAASVETEPATPSHIVEVPTIAIPKPRSKQSGATQLPKVVAPQQAQVLPSPQPVTVKDEVSSESQKPIKPKKPKANPSQLPASSKAELVVETEETRQLAIVKRTKAEITEMHKLCGLTITELKTLKASLPKCTNAQDVERVNATRTNIQSKIDQLSGFSGRRLGKYSLEELQAHLKEGQSMMAEMDRSIKGTESYIEGLNQSLAEASKKVEQEPPTKTVVPQTKKAKSVDTSADVAKAANLAQQLRDAQESLTAQYAEVDRFLVEAEQALGKGGQKARESLGKSIADVLAVDATSLGVSDIKTHLASMEQILTKAQEASGKVAQHLAVLEGQKVERAKRARKAEQEKTYAEYIENTTFFMQLNGSLGKMSAMRLTLDEAKPNFEAFERLVHELAKEITTYDSEGACMIISGLLQLLRNETWQAKLIEDMVDLYARTSHTAPENTFYHMREGKLFPLQVNPSSEEESPTLQYYMQCMIAQACEVLPCLEQIMGTLAGDFKEAREELLKTKTEARANLERLKTTTQRSTDIAFANKKLCEELGIPVSQTAETDIKHHDGNMLRGIQLSIQAIDSMSGEELVSLVKDTKESVKNIEKNESTMLRAQKTLHHMLGLHGCAQFLHEYLKESQTLARDPSRMALAGLHKGLSELKDVLYKEKRGVGERATAIKTALGQTDFVSALQAFFDKRIEQTNAEIAKCEKVIDECGQIAYRDFPEVRAAAEPLQLELQAVDKEIKAAQDDQKIEALNTKKREVELRLANAISDKTNKLPETLPLRTKVGCAYLDQKGYEQCVETLQSGTLQTEWRDLLSKLPQALADIMRAYPPSAPAGVTKKK